MEYNVIITNAKVEPYNYASVGMNALANLTTYLITFDVTITGIDYITSVIPKITNNRDSSILSSQAVTDGVGAPASFSIVDLVEKPTGTLTYTITVDWGIKHVTKDVSIEVYDYTKPKITPTIVRNENEEMVLTYTDLEYTEMIGSEYNQLFDFYVVCTTSDLGYQRKVYTTDLHDKTPPITLTGTYDIARPYTFTIYMKDSIHKWSTEVMVPSDRPILDIGADGNTVTFFGVSPKTADTESLRIKDVAIFGDVSRIGTDIGPRIELNKSTVDIYFDTTIHGDVSVNDKSIHDLVGGIILHGYSSTAQSTGADNSKSTTLKCFTRVEHGAREDFASPSTDGTTLYINKTGIYNFQLRFSYNGATQYKRFEIAPYMNGSRQAQFATTYGADGSNRTLQQLINYTLMLDAGDMVSFVIKPIEGTSLNVIPNDITVMVLDYEGKYQ